MSISPKHLEVVGDFLAVKWSDESESVVALATLRRHCPCARCAGEPDVTGAVRRPAHAPTLTDTSFQLQGLERVGNYAVAPTWADGHNTGIFSWKSILELAALDDAEI